LGCSVYKSFYTLYNISKGGFVPVFVYMMITAPSDMEGAVYFGGYNEG